MTLTRPLLFVILCAALAACGSPKKSAQNNTGEPRKEIADEKTRMLFDDAFFNGQREKVLGNSEKAIEYFNKALAIYPQNAAVHFELSELFFQSGRLPLALEHCNKAIALNGENIHYYQLQGAIYNTLQKHELAAKSYREIMRILPGNPDAYFNAANQYIYAKKYNEALDVYQQMEDRFGVNEDIVMQKEQLFLTLGKPEKAVLEIQKLIDLVPGETRYQGMLAELYWSMGKKQESVALYKAILQKEPGNGYAHFGMAEYYRTENNRDEMLKSLLEAFKDPRIESKSKTQVVLSLAPLIERDPALKKPVIELAEAIAQTHSSEALPHGILAALYLNFEEDEKALASYENYLRIDRSDYKVWQNYLQLLEVKRDFAKLAEQSETALEYFPNQALLYYFNASANLRLMNYRKSLESAQAGLDLYAPEENINAMLHTLMGDAYNELKEFAKSDAAYEKALLIEPDNAYVLNNYAYHLSLRKENLEKAKTMSQKSLRLEPENPSYLDTYGWILYQNGEYEEAAKLVRRALEIDGGSPEVLEHMGDILYKLGQKSEAKEYWKKALELNPESPSLQQKTNGIINL